VLKAHTSNYAVTGFTAAVDEAELARLARARGVPFAIDLGSGALIDLAQFGLPREPLPQDALNAGADLVMFSGDKLLGGPQAGIIVGRADLIAKIKRDPLKRALRVSKLTLAALEATLRLYRDPETLRAAIPVLRMLGEPASAVRARARRVVRGLGAELAVLTGAEVIASTAEVGGGSMPLARVPSYAVSVRAPRGKIADFARALRLAPDPVLGRIESDRLLFDMRTVAKSEVPRLIASLVRASRGEGKQG
jgi:L-seryl-tRNA(Ser) seleniumtransferase